MNRMKNIILLPALLLLVATGLFAQRIIEVTYKQDAKGNYQFYCTNNAYCDYILEINFSSLENAKPDHVMPFRGEVKPGSNKLFNVLKENANNPIQFKYTSRYNKGCIDPKVDSNFVYMLPIAAGKEAQAYELTNAEKPGPGEPQPKDWYMIRLRMKPGDTIYSARRGVVTEVEVGSNLNDSGVASIGSENYIEIVHADCSFGHYGILKRNSSFVKPGQFVEAGVPIGLVGGDKYGRGSDARFSVYYNIEEMEGSNVKTYSLYIPLLFWTKNNGKGKLKHGAMYISEHPATIISQEKPKTQKKGKTKQQVRS